MTKNASFVIVYCDGACTGNPGPGGWGSIIVKGKMVQELGGSAPATTNNRMELTASIEALRRLKKGEEATVYTDSVYVIKGITQWIFGWQKRGWKNAEGEDIVNQDLWQDLNAARQGKTISWKFVRGHTGIPGNERCDQIAVAFSKGQYVDLYEGNGDHYSVDVFTPPIEENLPEAKSNNGPKAKALSYLSLLGGVAERHSNWTDCERRVKGRSGAKFKKAMNAQDEENILRSWGVDPKSMKLK